jgi:hypothetical protein
VKPRPRPHRVTLADLNVREPGLPDAMPYYFRHASRFEHQHVRAALWRPRRLRSVHRRLPKTAEHALLDCSAYAPLRADARFASLFAQPLPAGAARWPAFVHTHDQRTLASLVHACVEDRAQHPRPA